MVWLLFKIKEDAPLWLAGAVFMAEGVVLGVMLVLFYRQIVPLTMKWVISILCKT